MHHGQSVAWSVCLSVCLSHSVCPFVRLSVYLFVCLSFWLSDVYLFASYFVCPPISLTLSLFVYLPICLFDYLMSVCMSVDFSCMSVCLPITCMSVCPSICLSVCLMFASPCAYYSSYRSWCAYACRSVLREISMFICVYAWRSMSVYNTSVSVCISVCMPRQYVALCCLYHSVCLPYNV